MSEPSDLKAIPGQLAIVDLAVQARAAGDLLEAGRLLGRLADELAPEALAPLVSRLGETWLDSIREDVPIMTVVIVEDELEEAGRAAAAGDLAKAWGHLREAMAYHPKAGTPHLGILTLYEGLSEHFLPAVEAPSEASELPTSQDAAADAGAPQDTPAVAEPTGAAPAEGQAPPAQPAAPPAPADAPAPPPAPGLEWIARGRETLAADPAAALRCFERAIDQAPDIVEGWQGLIRALVALGRLEEAVPACEHLLKVTPTDARAWAAYGAVLNRLGRQDQASFALRQAKQLEPVRG